MRLPIAFDKPASPLVRRVIAHVLCATFAGAFAVQAPNFARRSPERALAGFAEFSAACMQEALASPRYAERCRDGLERRARRLGSFVRGALRPEEGELAGLVSWFYEAIGIQVQMRWRDEAAGGAQESSACEPSSQKRASGGRAPANLGDLVFSRCYFSGFYSPGLCAFMSAFDSGFVGGLCGRGALAFDARITEGAPCCHARIAGETALRDKRFVSAGSCCGNARLYGGGETLTQEGQSERALQIEAGNLKPGD